MFKAKILEKYPSCNLDYLQKYLDLCNSPDIDGEKHHILPAHEWEEYKNLSSCDWNCAVLSPINHCLAHFYYAKCVNTINSWYAVMCMLNMKNDKNLRAYTELEIKELAKIYDEYSSNHRGLKRPTEICLKISEGKKRQQRKADIWKDPIKSELYTHWVLSGKLKRGRFCTYLTKLGYNYTTGNLGKLLREFENCGFIEPYED